MEEIYWLVHLGLQSRTFLTAAQWFCTIELFLIYAPDARGWTFPAAFFVFGAARRISHDRERLPLALRGWRISLFPILLAKRPIRWSREVRLQHRISGRNSDGR